jgi:DNA-directed RNA polymerase specialized sigma24 family protein
MLEQSQIETLQNLKHSSIRWIASHGLGLPEAEESEKLPAWFHRILKNTMLDEFRKSKMDLTKSHEYVSDIQPALDARTEEILCQRINGKKFKDLALESGQAEGTLRVRAQRAREKLKSMFLKCCNVSTLNQLRDCGCETK